MAGSRPGCRPEITFTRPARPASPRALALPRGRLRPARTPAKRVRRLPPRQRARRGRKTTVGASAAKYEASVAAVNGRTSPPDALASASTIVASGAVSQASRNGVGRSVKRKLEADIIGHGGPQVCRQCFVKLRGRLGRDVPPIDRQRAVGGHLIGRLAALDDGRRQRRRAESGVGWQRVRALVEGSNRLEDRLEGGDRVAPGLGFRGVGVGSREVYRPLESPPSRPYRRRGRWVRRRSPRPRLERVTRRPTPARRLPSRAPPRRGDRE